MNESAIINKNNSIARLKDDAARESIFNATSSNFHAIMMNFFPDSEHTYYRDEQGYFCIGKINLDQFEVLQKFEDYNEFVNYVYTIE